MFVCSACDYFNASRRMSDSSRTQALGLKIACPPHGQACPTNSVPIISGERVLGSAKHPCISERKRKTSSRDKADVKSPVEIEIINTGSELMLGYVLNTHQQWLCRQLSQRGYLVRRQVAVDDSAVAIQEAVREAIARSEIVLVTGGLGPTSDDRTRDLVAQLLGRTLKEDPDIIRHIEAFFGRRKRPMPASTRVQALVPAGAQVLPNPHGTAPGLAMEFGANGLLVMLPGPPRELRPMFTEAVVPLLNGKFGQPPNFACVVLRSTGIGESFLEEKIAPSLTDLVNRGLEVGYCARVGEVDVRFVARTADAEVLVREAEAIARDHLRSFIYGREPEELEAVVARLLTERQKTVALAESCTGGYIANRLTNVPGVSAVFLAGVVSYSNEAKQAFLGVREETLRAHGAVSEPVAREMCEGVRGRTGATYAISVTGIAGPSGGTAEKPVGTVFIGFSTPEKTEVKQMLNQYDRETFKFLTSQQALDLLRRELLKEID
jgi:nicotinamide-nucleotide amidase